MQSAVEAVRPRLASAALPDLELLDSAIRRVRDRWPDLAARPEEQPDVVVRKFRDRYKRSHWNGTTVAFALRAAKVLFGADHSNRRLYDEPRVLDELRSFCIEVTKTSTQRSFVAGMMSIYLASYEPNSRWSQQLGNALDRARDQLVKGTKWATLIGQFPRVFRGNRAHTELSSRMLRMHDPWREILDMGMRSPHAPGLMDHVHLEYVAKLDRSGKLRERAAVEGLLRWLRPDGKRGRATGVSEALEAILNPWRHSDPPQPLKDLLLERLVTCFGDPRMRAETWSTVREDCKFVIYRWLAGEDIRFFLDVVSAAETSHMWAPRRRFWLGLYEEGIVEAAWAAFSWQAERHAENSRKLSKRGVRPTWISA